MNRRLSVVGVAVLGLVLGLYVIPSLTADEEPANVANQADQGKDKQDKPADKAAEKEKKEWKPAVEPKELSENVKKGLKWLVSQQHENGGWAQGEEAKSQGSRIQGKSAETPNVGETCAAMLALLRSGSTPKKGDYQQNILKALEFIATSVENSETDSLYVTDLRGTRLQGKLGQYIDTFLAALVLSEVKDEMPDEQSNRRIAAALDRVIHKMEKNQRKDGNFAGQGWASTLSQGIATKAINRAAQKGAAVDEQTLKLAEENARKKFNNGDGRVAAGGSAGVELYARAAQISGAQDSVNTKTQAKQQAGEQLAELRKQIANAPAPQREALRVEVATVEKNLQEIEASEADLADAKDALIKRLDDKQFIAGFGSNGGEEFLSYVMIGETLVVEGGDKWKAWDKSIAQNLNRIQNKDGSWSGHHCITGRTFCTSAALLVLMTDRAPHPLAGGFQRR